MNTQYFSMPRHVYLSIWQETMENFLQIFTFLVTGLFLVNKERARSRRKTIFIIIMSVCCVEHCVSTSPFHLCLQRVYTFFRRNLKVISCVYLLFS